MAVELSSVQLRDDRSRETIAILNVLSYTLTRPDLFSKIKWV